MTNMTIVQCDTLYRGLHALQQKNSEVTLMSKITNVAKGISGRIVGPEPEDGAEHFYLCSICSQAVDMRDLGQVVHHESGEHEPIDSDG